MRIGQVTGTVTLNRCHPTLLGKSFKLVVPLSLDELNDETRMSGVEVVVLDELGAGVGSQIAISEGAEASVPFYPEPKPVDAYNAAILDTIDIDPNALKLTNDR